MNGARPPAAVILAAGASARMGRSKPLLLFEGKTFLERSIERFADICDPIVVVVRHGMGHVKQARFVVNPEPEGGMLSSLQCGLRGVGDCDAVLFTPVDLPAMARSSVEAVAASAGKIVIPRHKGRNGHPVRVNAEIVAELLAASVAGKAHDVLRRHRAETRFIDVDDAGIVHDVDTPGDYDALLAAHGVRT